MRSHTCLALALLVCDPSPALATAPREQAPTAALVLGPLVAPAPVAGEGSRALELVPELDPVRAWPRAGESVAWAPGAAARWSETTLRDGRLELPGLESSVTWLAFYLKVDRYAAWTANVTAPGEVRVWIDGLGLDEDPRPLARGIHRFLVRVADGGAVSFALGTGDADVRGRFSIEPRHALASYDELRSLSELDHLALSADGELLAYTEADEAGFDERARASLNVVRTSDGSFAASGLGGPEAEPVAWRRDGRALLFRDDEDLLVWSRDSGRVRRVLVAEPGLGAVSWSDDGTFLVFSSTRGVAERAPGNRRRTELREKLEDWPTGPHLHLLMLDSGVRRRLTLPGDRSQDAFALLPDGRTLLYLWNLPTDERPWFRTEFRTLDLRDGSDRLVAGLSMGFENRPGLFGFAVSPDGRRAAFVGPPSPLGDDEPGEPNAYDADLWILEIASGRVERLSAGIDAAVAGSVHWTPDSRAVWFEADAGSRSRLVRLDLEGGVESLPLGEGAADAVAFAGDGAWAAVLSRPDAPPALWVSGRATPLVDPDLDVVSHWTLPAPIDATYTGPDGSTIEAWLYRPAEEVSPDDGGRLPWIVSYYGGAAATAYRFNELHQFLVGNGYAVLVINPRGAPGYGQTFADQHVAEWGERAGADVLAGVSAVLEAHPELDPERIGCYGGSYGGFMTMWLIAHDTRFAAAVALYGISDIASYHGVGMWGYTYGDQSIRHYPWRDPQWFVEHSPLYSADRIDTPLLLLHGDEDRNVPPEESEQMFTALRLLGRTVELVRFPGEKHGLRGTWDNRVAHRTMLLEWFDRYLRDRPEAWDARWAE